MRHVLRSLIYMEHAERDAATANFAHVRRDRLLDLSEAEGKVLDHVLDFYRQHTEAPVYAVVLEHFSRLNDAEAVDLIGESGAQIFRSGASFEETFEAVVDRKAIMAQKRVFQDALKIGTEGVDFQGTLRRGPRDAASHVFSTLEVPPPKDSTRLDPDMRTSAAGLIELYAWRKANPTLAFGVPTGYRFLDSLTGGSRKKSLYIHAGFAAHLKSTFVLNQCVRGVCSGWSLALFSTEMPAEELMFMVVAIHSANLKFRGRHVPLNARKLCGGRLSDGEEEFFREVQEDFLKGKKHGRLRIYDSADFETFGGVMQIAAREHMKNPLDVIWIDYVTDLQLDAKYARMDHTTGMNLTLREAKQFAMSFNGGEGIAVNTAFQVNREGFRRGKDNGGRLDATALNQFNAAEKVADVITYSWYYDDQKTAHEALIGMMKNRWGPVLLDPVPVYYAETSRCLHEMVGPSVTPSEVQTAGLDIVDL